HQRGQREPDHRRQMIEPHQGEIADQNDRQEQENERVGVEEHQSLSQLFVMADAPHSSVYWGRRSRTRVPGITSMGEKPNHTSRRATSLRGCGAMAAALAIGSIEPICHQDTANTKMRT